MVIHMLPRPIDSRAGLRGPSLGSRRARRWTAAAVALAAATLGCDRPPSAISIAAATKATLSAMRFNLGPCNAGETGESFSITLDSASTRRIGRFDAQTRTWPAQVEVFGRCNAASSDGLLAALGIAGVDTLRTIVVVRARRTDFDSLGVAYVSSNLRFDSTGSDVLTAMHRFSLKSALRNLETAEEEYAADHGTYATRVSDLSGLFSPPSDAIVMVVPDSGGGSRAIASRADYPGFCSFKLPREASADALSRVLPSCE